MNKGYYSLVQFCPDRARAEAVNVGVILLCPDLKFLEVRMSPSNVRVKSLFGGPGWNTSALNRTKESMEARIRSLRQEATSIEAFSSFVDTRANDLLLTAPRSTAVSDPVADLDRLYRKLVSEDVDDDEAPESPHAQFVGLIRKVFSSRPALNHRLQGKTTVMVPMIERPFHADFAYSNGRFNLIKAEMFSAVEGHAINQAEQLVVEGGLIQADRALDGLQKKLIIVSSSEERNSPVVAKAGRILKSFDIEVVGSDSLEKFADRIVAETHD